MDNQLIVDMETSKNFNDYNQQRDKIKNGIFTTFIIFFKSTVGVGLLANQMYYFTSGYILGPIIALVITGLICYNMILAVSVADDIEEKDLDVTINNLDELALYSFRNETSSKAFYVSKKSKYKFTFISFQLNIVYRRIIYGYSETFNYLIDLRWEIVCIHFELVCDHHQLY